MIIKSHLMLQKPKKPKRRGSIIISNHMIDNKAFWVSLDIEHDRSTCGIHGICGPSFGW